MPAVIVYTWTLRCGIASLKLSRKWYKLCCLEFVGICVSWGKQTLGLHACKTQQELLLLDLADTQGMKYDDIKSEITYSQSVFWSTDR